MNPFESTNEEVGFEGRGDGVRAVPSINFDHDQFDSELDCLKEELTKLTPSEIVERMYEWHHGKNKSQNTVENSTLLRRIVAFLLSHDSTKLAALGLSYAAGLDVANGETMTAAAKRMCCTRAAISKIANEVVDYLELPRSRYLKSDNARSAYRERAKKVHKTRIKAYEKK